MHSCSSMVCYWTDPSPFIHAPFTNVTILCTALLCSVTQADVFLSFLSSFLSSGQRHRSHCIQPDTSCYLLLHPEPAHLPHYRLVYSHLRLTRYLLDPFHPPNRPIMRAIYLPRCTTHSHTQCALLVRSSPTTHLANTPLRLSPCLLPPPRYMIHTTRFLLSRCPMSHHHNTRI